MFSWLHRAVARGMTLPAAHQQAELDVAQHGQPGEQRRILEHDAAIEAPPALLTGASARPREDLPEVAIAHVGFHRVGDMVVAANLGDARESDTTAPAELALGGRKLAPPDPPVWRGGIRLGRLALWLALALLLFEWASYHRRWTT